MFLKLCGITDEADLESALQAEPAAIGFQVGQRFAGKDFILPSTAARLSAALPPFVTGVMVTDFDNADAIAEAVGRSGLLTIQCRALPSEEVKKLRERFGDGIKLIDCLFASGLRTSGEIDPGRRLDFNAFNLDWYHQSTESREETGEYLLELARELIAGSPVKFILSGKLTPEKIREAAAAGAWGIDVSEYIHEGTGELRHVSGVRCMELRHALNALGNGD